MNPPLSKGGFARDVVAWQRRHGRHGLPWQSNPTPYRVWVSEIMLQQTQASVVEPYYRRFMERFPDIGALAEAEADDVLALWSGLGYYARGRNLHASARIIAGERDGAFPDTLDGLTALPGIGKSTAGAILSLAFGKPHAVLDGNVARVLARVGAIEDPLRSSAARSALWKLAESLLPQRSSEAYAQGMMDLGALLCRVREPLCGQCPVRSRCAAHVRGIVGRIPVESRVLPKKEILLSLAIVLCRRHVLLFRRPVDGFWGGLLTPPIFEADDECRAFAGRFGGQRSLRPLDPFTAVFSHMRIGFRPCLSEADRRIRMKGAKWVNLDFLRQTGLPAPVRKMLENLAERESGAADGRRICG